MIEPGVEALPIGMLVPSKLNDFAQLPATVAVPVVGDRVTVFAYIASLSSSRMFWTSDDASPWLLAVCIVFMAFTIMPPVTRAIIDEMPTEIMSSISEKPLGLSAGVSKLDGIKRTNSIAILFR